jgi:hypothetical protein
MGKERGHQRLAVSLPNVPEDPTRRRRGDPGRRLAATGGRDEELCTRNYVERQCESVELDGPDLTENDD